MINKKIKWKIAIVVLAIVMIGLIVPFRGQIVAQVEKITSADVIVLDPGHGGIDGGAQSASGTCEKDINLAIAARIKALAEEDGFKVVMTREEDEGLCTDKGKSIRSQKTEDLQARKKIIENVKPLMAISIHLNSFKQDSSVRGAQVFYSTGGSDEMTSNGKRLAESIQETLVKGLDDGTNRVALGKRDVMLLKNPIAPTVIIECGFLSNEDEAKMLIDVRYQAKLAKFIYEGILSYSGLEPKLNMEIIESKGMV